MKNQSLCVIPILLLIFLFHSADAAEKEKSVSEQKSASKSQIKEVSIMGITLGKSLTELGIKECPYQGASDSPLKNYELSNQENCYRTLDFYNLGKRSCLTYVDTSKRLSFFTHSYVVLKGECDRSSPIKELQTSFDESNATSMLKLLTEKFGEPSTETSVVQNKMGAKFDKFEASWDIDGNLIYLTNRHIEIDKGFLSATHKDLAAERLEQHRKTKASDKDKI
jgi:hypothetical protein